MHRPQGALVFGCSIFILKVYELQLVFLLSDSRSPTRLRPSFVLKPESCTWIERIIIRTSIRRKFAGVSARCNSPRTWNPFTMEKRFWSTEMQACDIISRSDCEPPLFISQLLFALVQRDLRLLSVSSPTKKSCIPACVQIYTLTLESRGDSPRFIFASSASYSRLGKLILPGSQCMRACSRSWGNGKEEQTEGKTCTLSRGTAESAILFWFFFLRLFCRLYP